MLLVSAFQSLGFQRHLMKLFQKRVVRTKLDINVFIFVQYMLSWCSWYLIKIVHPIERFISIFRIQFTMGDPNTLQLSIGECPSNSPFLKNIGAESPKGPSPIVFKEWRDARTFSNLKSTHCTLLIWLIINLVTKKSLCIVSKVQREL